LANESKKKSLKGISSTKNATELKKLLSDAHITPDGISDKSTTKLKKPLTTMPTTTVVTQSNSISKKNAAFDCISARN